MMHGTVNINYVTFTVEQSVVLLRMVLVSPSSSSAILDEATCRRTSHSKAFSPSFLYWHRHRIKSRTKPAGSTVACSCSSCSGTNYGLFAVSVYVTASIFKLTCDVTKQNDRLIFSKITMCCCMAFLDMGATCNTSILSTRAFSIVLKHVCHTIYTRRFETSWVYNMLRNVVCMYCGVWFT